MSNYYVLHVTCNKIKTDLKCNRGNHYILRHFEMENGEALLNLHAEFIGTFQFKYCDIKALSL